MKVNWSSKVNNIYIDHSVVSENHISFKKSLANNVVTQLSRPISVNNILNQVQNREYLYRACTSHWQYLR